MIQSHYQNKSEIWLIFFTQPPLITYKKPNTQTFVGGVAEWLNAPVLKTDVGESLPWVRIPPPPPQIPNTYLFGL